jgi:hypothetical protein
MAGRKPPKDKIKRYPQDDGYTGRFRWPNGQGFNFDQAILGYADSGSTVGVIIVTDERFGGGKEGAASAISPQPRGNSHAEARRETGHSLTAATSTHGRQAFLRRASDLSHTSRRRG